MKTTVLVMAMRAAIATDLIETASSGVSKILANSFAGSAAEWPEARAARP